MQLCVERSNHLLEREITGGSFVHFLLAEEEAAVGAFQSNGRRVTEGCAEVLYF